MEIIGPLEAVVRILLDRSRCKRSRIECEACFGQHIRKGDFAKADCLVSTDDQNRIEMVFSITDRDHSAKSLVVNEENIHLALKSWISLWEEQSGPII